MSVGDKQEEGFFFSNNKSLRVKVKHKLSMLKYSNQEKEAIFFSLASFFFLVLFLFYFSLIRNITLVYRLYSTMPSTIHPINMQFLLYLFIINITLSYTDVLTKFNITIKTPGNEVSIRQIPYVCRLLRCFSLIIWIFCLEINTCEIYRAE
jgi:hypothetical protein